MVNPTNRALASSLARSAVGQLGPLAVLAVLAGALAVSFAVTPEDIETGRVVLSPECWFRTLFGHGCPTCGMTRAFAALSHGRVVDAFRYNLAAPFLYVGWWVVTLGLAWSTVREWAASREFVGAPPTEGRR